jgi:hypothetical protein
MYGRPETCDLAEVLMDLEAEPEIQLRVTETILESLGDDERGD